MIKVGVNKKYLFIFRLYTFLNICFFAEKNTMTSFKQLHYQSHPLLIANVWDVMSAKVAEKLNFQAIGTSSAAIANMLGYQDGEEMTFSELEYIVKRITPNSKLPLTVDIEGGFDRTALGIVENIKRLTDLGVVGVNIEDSLVSEDRYLVDSNDFSKMMGEVKNKLSQHNIDCFLNIRTDSFLIGVNDAVAETNKRVVQYEQEGADGIFIPCATKEKDISDVIANTKLSVNVMCMPGLPDFDKLNELGVRRISMGNFIHKNLSEYLKEMFQSIERSGSFNPLFD